MLAREGACRSRALCGRELGPSKHAGNFSCAFRALSRPASGFGFVAGGGAGSNRVGQSAHQSAAAFEAAAFLGAPKVSARNGFHPAGETLPQVQYARAMVLGPETRQFQGIPWLAPAPLRGPIIWTRGCGHRGPWGLDRQPSVGDIWNRTGAFRFRRPLRLFVQLRGERSRFSEENCPFQEKRAESGEDTPVCR